MNGKNILIVHLPTDIYYMTTPAKYHSIPALLPDAVMDTLLYNLLYK